MEAVGSMTGPDIPGRPAEASRHGRRGSGVAVLKPLLCLVVLVVMVFLAEKLGLL